MKAFKLIALCAASAAILCSCCGGKSASGSQPKGITREDVKNASYMIGYNFGQILKGNNFGPMDMAQINKGIKDACADVELDQELFYQTLNGFLEKRNNVLRKRTRRRTPNSLRKMHWKTVWSPPNPVCSTKWSAPVTASPRPPLPTR